MNAPWRPRRTGDRALQGPGLAALALSFATAAASLTSCSKPPAPPPAPPAKHFPAPVFDGLSLGMTRAEAMRQHPMRPAVTAAGKTLRVWVYERKGDYTAHLTFPDKSESARLGRIDVHYGRSDEPVQQVIGRLSEVYGKPDVTREQPSIKSYGDRTHQEFDTIWSDAEQYVFLTERVPLPGRQGLPAYFLTIKKKKILAKAPPTGYVPPPELDENGQPVPEEEPF